jgi:glycosyltransferase involved in cell wall biosynthesis
MNRKPKLIRVTTSPLSLRSLLSNQMKFMKENGFDVIMVSSEGKEWSSIVENEKCDYRIVPMARQIAPLRDLRSLWKLYRLFKKERPDIIHSHTPKAGLLSMLAARFAGIKIRVHTVAGLRFMTATGMLKRILISMERLTGRSAVRVWPNSHSLLNYIRKNGLVQERKLELIGNGSSNGVDLRRFSPSSVTESSTREIKELIKYDEELTYILSMGRIVKDKGIEELVRAFARLHEKNSKLRLILLGHFEDKLDPVSAECMQTINSHPGIIHIDWNEKVEYFMLISRLLVHASHREGFPNTLLQAGAMNCPIVCSAIEGNVDVVNHGETGLLFDPGNENDLYEKLSQALSHREIMNDFAARLRRKIENNFSQEYVHRCLKEKYLELLQKRA